MTAAFDTGGNVTRLDRKRAARNAAAGKPATRAHELMEHCRRQLREQVKASLPGILDQVDDTLFDLADKADTNQLQSTYFEAMRSLRLCRDEVEARFLGALDDAMDERGRPGGGAGSGSRGRGVVALSLVDPDELEESVAVKSVAAKIRNLCREDLFALDRRVALLLSNPTVEGEDNPLSPEAICDSARAAVGVIDSDLEIRLVVLKLFDRHLTRMAERFYPELNAWLARQGVLPDVSAAVAPRPASPPARQRARGDAPRPRTAPPAGESDPWAGGRDAARDEGWEQFHGEHFGGAGYGSGAGGGHGAVPGGGAHGAHGGDAVPGAGGGYGTAPAGGVPGAYGGTVAPGAPAGEGVASGGGGTPGHAAGAGADARPEAPAGAGRAASPGHGGPPRGPRGEQVLGVLNEVMRVGGGVEQGEPAPGRERFILGLTALQREPADVRAGGNVLRDLRASGAASGVSHVDGLMIDVVAMMFEFILEDSNIGDGMRALIGRLQIPVLKVAILDKSFFARRSHPARSFVNSLAELGARLHGNDPDHAPVIGRVQALVTRILDDFDAELDVFTSALEDLEALIREEDETLKRGAWSSAHAAEARERLVRARRSAEEHVDGCLEGVDAPAPVAEFLRRHWRHLLGERLFREGTEGEGWRTGVETMELLLWSVTPKTAPADRERLLAELPSLLEGLKSGIRELGLATDVRDPLLQDLSRLHIAALRGTSAEEVPPAAPHAKAADPASVAGDAGTSADGPEEAPAPGEQTARRLREAVEQANALVWRTASEQPQCEGMGATVVAVKLDGDRLVCAHAGDSRLYRLRDGELDAITEDHTYRREAVARGLVSEEDAAQIAGNMITRAVGGGATIDVEVNVHVTAPGDLYLCCSDGLSDMLDDGQIAALLREDPQAEDLEGLAGRLVAAANAAGGRDNVSVGLLRIDEALPAAGSGAGPRDYGAFARTAALTDPGRRRAHNEDCIECDAAAGAVVLADGMGGHNAGEVASAMAVKVLTEALAAPRAAAGEGFDYGRIEAVFWSEQLGPDGDGVPVGADVEHIVLESGDDLDECFDVDGDARTLPGDDADRVVRDAARDPLLERVLRLRCGTWVEFGERAGDGVRAHLSWIAPGGARFLFTDRAGNKVSDATPHGLAVELRAGRMRVLDGAPLFERALGALTRRLRGAQDGAHAGDGPAAGATVH